MRTLMLQIVKQIEQTALMNPQGSVICPSDDVFRHMSVLGTENSNFAEVTRS